MPLVFTEYGVAMLSSVLKSERAIQVSISIMRTFGKLREILESNKEFATHLSDRVTSGAGTGTPSPKKYPASPQTVRG